MRVGRTIAAFLVALSLAMLPLSHAVPMASDETGTAHEIVGSQHHHCDHGQMPIDHGIKDIQSSADCAAKCSNVYAVVVFSAMISPPPGGMESSFISNPFDSQPASPPYRPPRI
jgi:hypothetical protein